jgi:hypothetical protein
MDLALIMYNSTNSLVGNWLIYIARFSLSIQQVGIARGRCCDPMDRCLSTPWVLERGNFFLAGLFSSTGFADNVKKICQNPEV